jgi:integrase
MLYLTAAYTGLRASELASLTPESFDLDARTPAVTVAAGYSKHRREDTVPLHAELVARLRPWLAAKAAGERVWPGNWAANKGAGKMLQADLKKARAAWVNDAKTSEEGQRREATETPTSG